MRKIIQITSVPESNNNKLGFFALCDDGTVWHCYQTQMSKHYWRWTQVSPILSSSSILDIETRLFNLEQSLKPIGPIKSPKEFSELNFDIINTVLTDYEIKK